MKLFANITSILFHPLLMVTYGMILALSFTYLAIYPLSMKLVIAGGAFISTAVMPGFFILLFVKSGAAGDLELTDRKERFVPYFHRSLFLSYAKADDARMDSCIAGSNSD